MDRYELDQSVTTLCGKEYCIQNQGFHVQIIDYTLSRMELEHGVLFCDLENDPEIFKGPKGVPQFDVYRQMRGRDSVNPE